MVVDLLGSIDVKIGLREFFYFILRVKESGFFRIGGDIIKSFFENLISVFNLGCVFFFGLKKGFKVEIFYKMCLCF